MNKQQFLSVLMAAILQWEGAEPTDNKEWSMPKEIADLGKQLSEYLANRELNATTNYDDYTYLYFAIVRDTPQNKKQEQTQ